MSNETDKPTPDVIPEHDRLGPLGAVKAGPPGPRFGEGGDARRALLDAFRAALDDAGEAARDPSIDQAVHGVRKSLRRARAILHIMAPALRKRDRRDLAAALVEARRQLSATRDLAVVPGALQLVTLDEDLRAAAAMIVASAGTSAPASEEVRGHLAAAVASTAALGELLDAALPAHLDDDDVLDGVTDTYRAARSALDEARGSRRAFHVFRKRAKELGYQLEVLADGLEGEVEGLRRQVVELGDELGQVVDVLMLRRFLRDHGGDAGAEVGKRLDVAIRDELDRRSGLAQERARALFDRGGKKFARRLAKAMARDHAPAAPPADN